MNGLENDSVSSLLTGETLAINLVLVIVDDYDSEIGCFIRWIYQMTDND